MKQLLYCIITCLFLVNCNQNTKSVTNLEKYKKTGDSITLELQSKLLLNLNKAINDSGFIYAIKFCNINADNITNSSGKDKRVISIQRISDKTRNPNNNLNLEIDKNIFEQLKKTEKDTAIIESNDIIYYKPIKIMMPNCLKCHGGNENTDSITLKNILLKYPNDKATNYVLGDLRGMWKVKLKGDASK